MPVFPRQVAQRPRDGSISVREVPPPALKPGSALVATRFSLISAGTERSKVELGRKGLVAKARARPDMVRKVVDRARVEGIRSTARVTRDRLEGLDPLGYSSAGVVTAIGAGVNGIAPGDRVACGGGGWANHAELAVVPQNLMAHVPDDVRLEDAAYATVGAVALHAVRQAEASLGERVGVIGLGLVGQLALRILAAAGCTPFGIDPDPRAVQVAEESGAASFGGDGAELAAALRGTASVGGLDAVLVCASAPTSEPVELAARIARERARIVVVGDVPVAMDRALMYEKELELRISRSYGPGRYDRDYEERGRDLPAGYVRWTEQRNLQAFVDLLGAGKLNPGPLTTHRFRIDAAARAYETLLDGGSEGRPFGVLLEYPEREPTPVPAPPAGLRPESHNGRRRGSRNPRIGLIGAGSFARGVLLPSLERHGAELTAVSSEGGLSAADVAARYGFSRAAGSAEDIVAAEDVEAVVIATRHQSHAQLAAAALAAGKSVLVEKPLALSWEQLNAVEDALSTQGGTLMVGFNRRFAPLVERVVATIPPTPDMVLTARVNAGPLPAAHWAHDPEDGGGRLLGEGCHFVDLLAHLAGSPVVAGHAFATPQPERPLECSDSIAASMRFANGAVATLTYSGGGDSRLPKERLEAFGGGVAVTLDDFRRLETYVGGKRDVVKAPQDKGHSHEVARFLAAVSGSGEPPTPESYLASTRATLALADSLRDGLPFDLR